MSYKELKDLYTEILSITIDIISDFENNKLDNAQETVNKREKLLKKTVSLRKKLNPSTEEKNELNKLIDNIKKQEKALFLVHKKKKIEAAKEIVSVTKTTKLMNAYIIKSNEVQPRIVDAKE